MKMINNLFPISKIGFKYLGYSLGIFVLSSLFDLDLLAFFSFVSFFIMVYIFRNPEREVSPFTESSVISPVDGLIVSIQEIQDEKYAYKVEIDSSYLNVGVLRTPVDGSVKSMSLVRGTRVSRDDRLFPSTNEYAELEFVNEVSNCVKVVHRLKRSFVHISLTVIESQKLRQTTRYGNLINGVTYLYLPQNFRLNISVGNELKASESLIGYFS